MPKRRFRIYTCDKHKWTLETATPEVAGGLKVFCPLCKDEFFAAHLPEPGMRVEMREKE